jgi:hypothetical protein
MELHDVDHVRRNDRQSQRHEAIREEQRAADHLDALDEREHVPGRGEGTQKRHGLVRRGGRRKLPGAQPAEGAAKAIVDVIENPRPEAYTSPFIADVIARYLREPEAVEAEIAGRTR